MWTLGAWGRSNLNGLQPYVSERHVSLVGAPEGLQGNVADVELRVVVNSEPYKAIRNDGRTRVCAYIQISIHVSMYKSICIYICTLLYTHI